MKKIIVPIIIVVLISAVVGTVIGTQNRVQPREKKPLIVTTLFPLEEWARVLGGENVEVVNIIPDGTEPHDYEPTAHDLQLLERANVVVSVGYGFDDHLTQALPQEKVLTFLEHAVVHEADHTDEVETEDEHHHAEGLDPHVWLDFDNMKTMVAALATTLNTYAPGAKDRAVIYTQRLTQLEERYRAGLTQCESRNVIVAHDAFGYLGEQFALTFHPIMGLSPEGEPNARVLAELTAEAKELGVTTVYFETLTSPQVATTLAQEIGVTTAVLDPAEGLTAAGRRSGQTFLGIMEQNLQALRQGLRCL